MRVIVAALVIAIAFTAGAVRAEDAIAVRAEDAMRGAEKLYFGGERQGASRVPPCAGCHGLDAGGGRDGGRDFPAIGGDVLFATASHRSAYGNGDFARALGEGLAPGGRALSPIMPRYALHASEVAALELFMRGIDKGRAHGRHPDALVIGVAASSAEHDAEFAGAVAAFARGIDTANEAGGVWGRKIRIAFLPPGGEPLDAVLAADPPLAVVMWPGAVGEAAFATRGIPELFPWPNVPVGAMRNRIRDLKPTWPDVLRAIGTHLLARDLKPVALSRPADAVEAIVLRASGLTLHEGGTAERAQATIVLPGIDAPALELICRSATGLVVLWRGVGTSPPPDCRDRLLFADSEGPPDRGHPELAALGNVLGPGDHRGPRLGSTAALAFVAAAIEAGARVNRRTIVDAFDRMAPVTSHVWPSLDWRRVPASGTRAVSFSAF